MKEPRYCTSINACASKRFAPNGAALCTKKPCRWESRIEDPKLRAHTVRLSRDELESVIESMEGELRGGIRAGEPGLDVRWYQDLLRKLKEGLSVEEDIIKEES